jgi:PAS domain-containing protein
MRLLLVAMLALAIILVLRLASQRGGLLHADTGTWLLTLAIIAVLTGLAWGLAVTLGRTELASRTGRVAPRKDRPGGVAFEEAPVGSVLVSLDGRFTRVNRAFCEMTGYCAEELVGMRFNDVTHPDDRAQAAGSLAALVIGRIVVYHAEKRKRGA